MSFRARLTVMVLAGSATFFAGPDRGLFAQDKPARPKPEDTEVWKPVPPVVQPAPYKEVPAPEGAIILFDGKNLEEWINTRDGKPAEWILKDGVMVVNKKTGNIETRRKFKDYQLHIEYQVPENITGKGQGRGNSGLFLASTGGGDAGYELQILDSYQNETYVNGMAASIYKQATPLANPCRKPGEWNTYDITWKAPRFKSDGSLESPATVTVVFNGVLVQDKFELKGETVFIGQPKYKAYDTAGIKLQSHGDPSPPLSFKNIWIKEIK